MVFRRLLSVSLLLNWSLCCVSEKVVKEIEREELSWWGGKNSIDTQFWKSGRDGIEATETGIDETLHTPIMLTVLHRLSP